MVSSLFKGCRFLTRSPSTLCGVGTRSPRRAPAVAVGLFVGGLLLCLGLTEQRGLAAPKNPIPPAPSPAPAGRGPSDIESAETFYTNLDYENANRTAARTIQQKGLSHDHLLRAWRIVALTHAVLDRADEARDAFVQLLTYNPEYQVDANLGPKVTQPFLEARGFWRAQAAQPGVDVSVTGHAAGQPTTLRITPRDPTHVVDHITLGYRWGANGTFSTVPVAVGEGVVVETAIAPPGALRVDYYVQCLDKREDVVFEVGNPNAPKSATLDVPPAKPHDTPESKSVFKSPVFWTVVVVALGGGAVASYFLLTPKDPTSASLGSAAQCGAAPCR